MCSFDSSAHFTVAWTSSRVSPGKPSMKKPCVRMPMASVCSMSVRTLSIFRCFFTCFWMRGDALSIA